MSRLSNPGCMLRTLSALFGTIFLPVGISFFFVLKHRQWIQGVGAVLAALGFYYVAWRANDILGLDQIPGADEVPPLDLPAPPGDAAPPSSQEQEPAP
ncbi:MAG TPA: hypothetical protein VF737_15715 [Gemmatimonadaceae bacterium]